MKYRYKLFVSILIALIALNTLLYFSLRHHTDNLMLALETNQAEKAMQRLLNAFEREIDILDTLNVDWASWDDSYEFMINKNTDYLESNLVESTFTASELDLIVFVDTTGEPVYRQAYDREEEEHLEVPESFFAALQTNPKIWKFQQYGDLNKGFLRLPEGVLMLSARPILTSNDDGPVRGTLFMGRFFNELEQAQMQTLTQQAFNLFPVAVETIEQSKIQIHLTNDAFLSASAPIYDILDNPLWKLKVQFQRNFFQHGLHSLNTFMLWNFIITSLLAIIAGLVTDKLVLARKSVLENENLFRELSLELQTILDGIDSSIFLVSNEHRVIWGNRASSEIFGEAITIASGKTKLDIPFTNFIGLEHCPVETALSTGLKQEAMIQLEDQRIMRLTAFPLKDDTQMTQGVISMLTDITEQTRQQDEAEQRNRLTSLGELAAGMAHDINNPIGMLLINLPMIKDVYQDFIKVVENDPAVTTAEFGGLSLDYIKTKLPFLLDEMLHNSKKIKKMSEDLKNFTRTQPSTTIAFDLGQVINSALRLVDYKIVSATQKFNYKPEKDLPTLTGRPHQIEQVLINLILNSCQALSSNQQAISLTTLYDPTNSQIIIEVADEGVGIADDQLHNATKAFFTTKGEHGGTGLGLSMAERIIKQHSGTLELSSIPGAGTSARISLPVKQGE